MNNRSRNYSLVTYHSEEILKSVLLSASLIRHFAYIYHDKDKKEDLSYCVNIEIVHVLFDVLVFIPRLTHKWVRKAVQDE